MQNEESFLIHSYILYKGDMTCDTVISFTLMEYIIDP